VLLPAALEVIREFLELWVDVLLRHDLRALDALVEPPGDASNPLDVVHAGEHPQVLTLRRARDSPNAGSVRWPRFVRAAQRPAKWRAVVDPAVDRDGDGYTSHEGATLCVGAVLPEPYLAADLRVDCDDSSASVYRRVTLYRDEDGDGVGARPRAAAWTCIGASLPAGFSVVACDVDDSDPTVTADPAADAVLALILD
jgi:hypothetical protein